MHQSNFLKKRKEIQNSNSKEPCSAGECVCWVHLSSSPSGRGTAVLWNVWWGRPAGCRCLFPVDNPAGAHQQTRSLFFLYTSCKHLESELLAHSQSHQLQSCGELIVPELPFCVLPSDIWCFCLFPGKANSGYLQSVSSSASQKILESVNNLQGVGLEIPGWLKVYLINV